MIHPRCGALRPHIPSLLVTIIVNPISRTALSPRRERELYILSLHVFFRCIITITRTLDRDGYRASARKRRNRLPVVSRPICFPSSLPRFSHDSLKNENSFGHKFRSGVRRTQCEYLDHTAEEACRELQLAVTGVGPIWSGFGAVCADYLRTC